jgi:Flp pilus assembly protein TadG
LRRLLGRDERGAVGVIIAVLLGGGVLLGMGALAIDVGQIYQNRAELQNGADAAALAIARQCAQGACPANLVSFAGTYASHNASALTQGVAGVDCVYGVAGGSNFNGGGCPVGFNSGSGLTNCPKDPSTGSFVDVQTETGTVSTLLPPVFAQTLVGRSTYNGTTVKACAQAEWGPGGVAFTVSTCELNAALGAGGTDYWDPATHGPAASPAAADTQFLLHAGNGNNPDTTCNDGPAGHDAPGAFGWTTQGAIACFTVIVGNQYGADTGNSAKDCIQALTQAQASGTTVYVPVYTSVTGNGNNTVYTLDSFYPFVITGFQVPSASVPDTVNPTVWAQCGNGDTCIDGYFTSNQPFGGGGGQPGADNVKLTG